MKKFYVLVIVGCTITLFANAQFNVGQKVVGGNVGFSTNKWENIYNNNISSNSTYASISPSVASFCKPNLIHGLALSYSYNSQKNYYLPNSTNNAVDKSTTQSIGVSLFAQRFFSLSKKLFFTVASSAGGNYNFGKQVNTFNNVVTNGKINGYGVGANLAPGISYKITPRLLFDASLNNLLNISFFHSKTVFDKPNLYPTATQSSFNLSSSLSNTNLGNVGLGFRLLLKK